MQNVPNVGCDVLFYILSTSAAAVAQFETQLSASHPASIRSVWVETGFQRKNKRENFGYLDGLRNVAPAERAQVIFTDAERSPEEPAWTEGGTYLVYIKIAQNTQAMSGKSEEEQNQLIGRRKRDGSRLDLPEGTPVTAEGEFEGNACPVGAHIRKAGPRNALHDETKIFRRGVPYLTLNNDGSLAAGLQFVSFQRSLDEFAVIFTRWVTNPNFPAEGDGEDVLLAQAMITLEKYGLFFVPPYDERYIGASIFNPAPVDPCTVGRVVVQKQLLGKEGQPVLSELGGISFEVKDANGTTVGAPFATNPAGRAVSPPLPRGQQLTLHEVQAPKGFQATGDQTVTLTKARELITVVNELSPEGPPPIYSG